MSSATAIQTRIDELYRTEAGRVLGSVVRHIKDWDQAEEAVQEAFLAASKQWPSEGIPANPVAWLVTSARHKAIDTLRRQAKFKEMEPELARRMDELQGQQSDTSEHEIKDNHLRLIFTCCHPAIDPSIQVPLTLREVCGLTTEEIASAFLVPAATMAQRIVRGKTKIRDAGIPFQIPEMEELPERIESVLSVCYLVFNEGYSASSGESLTRPDLSAEAIRLGRLLGELLADAEVYGLLALMLLHESRREARTTFEGELVLLEDQDRTRWNRTHIDEARQWLNRAFAAEPIGAYTLQAAISLEHALAPTAEATNWQQIVQWYDLLMQTGSTPIIELNRAVALAMRDGPESGLLLIDELQHRKELANYHLIHAARADLLRRLGRHQDALAAYQLALTHVKQEPERRYLRKRMDELAFTRILPNPVDPPHPRSTTL
ncbi:MAG: RNA polymerase sigma factor [Gemmatales bacterium]